MNDVYMTTTHDNRMPGSLYMFCCNFTVKTFNTHELYHPVFLFLSRVQATSKCFCSALTVCCLHKGVLHCCCQLPLHFCGFNGPLCRHSASFEVHWVSQDLKNTQDTLSLFCGMWCRDSTAGLLWSLLALKDRCLAGNHTCRAWSHCTFTFGLEHKKASCLPLLLMWINCLGVSGLSLILLCLNIVRHFDSR